MVNRKKKKKKKEKKKKKVKIKEICLRKKISWLINPLVARWRLEMEINLSIEF